MATRSVKYSLTYSGKLAKDVKDSKKPIIYHVTQDKWGMACGYTIYHRLERKPTGKRYQLCVRCAKSVKKA